MHLNLNGNLWQEVTTRVVLQLLQTLSCLHFLDPFHSGKENELLLGLGESISILHFIMQAIFFNPGVKCKLPNIASLDLAKIITGIPQLSKLFIYLFSYLLTDS